ncbi:MAG: MBL fold metallo-hydrolase, partial [Alphaproteobacteria bacterium]
MITVTILGCGGSAGVPLIGGADGRCDWVAFDPNEPSTRRSRSSILIECDQGQMHLVDSGPDMR